MSETLETADEIKSIRFRIEAIESTQELLLRERAPHIRGPILDLFRRKWRLDAVYLAVDGRRSQAEIVEVLAAKGVPIGQATASRHMALLERERLIDKAAVGTRGVIWERNAAVERVLQLSRHLEEGLGDSGR